MLLDGRIAAQELHDLNTFLSLYVPRQTGVASPPLCRLLESWPVPKLYSMRRGMWALFSAHPLLRELDALIAERVQPAAMKYASYKTRARRFSVQPEELPASWKGALERMADGMPGQADRCLGVPVPSMQVTMRTKLCECIMAARVAGIPEEMSVAAMVAYEKSLLQRERPLSPVTIKSAIRQVQGFALYLGAPDDVLAHLAKRVRVHEGRANGSTPLKEAKVLALPSYEDIFEKAFDLLGEADATKNAVQAQFKRNAAVAMTLFCPFPVRAADTVMRFGREITWDGQMYRFDLVLSKNKRPYTAPIIPVFGFFIDQLILQGADLEHLADLRTACFQAKRPLFVTYEGRHPHPRYASHLWKQVLGTGGHAARTKLHDEFGRLGSRGVELAMRACGQRSEKTAEAYRTRAFQMLAIERAHADFIGEITDAEWKEFFG
ncbi:hypothetical protein [Falsirhodobacter algicola]|uniref:Uncharacterized protein n=1 Tax=Falsirhodobacter algicola TaxID=2692330 RepID=A0A8J8SLU9_9RHOB|nr:hypothetical protein [Falsirhodobacter algicola]QUS37405.1 hypothetical protein GR316_13555 [Falsirhodobacter algicola]